MNKEFRSLIEDIKERYNINQGEIAERLGVTRQYISTVIGGGAPFNDTLREKIRDTFPDASQIAPQDGYLPVVESAVKLYLKSNGMTMQDMADRLGCTQQAVSFSLKKGMGAATANRWADAFGFNSRFLLTGEGDLLGCENTSESQGCYVPLLPIFAQAGHLTGWSEGIKEYECERVISPVKDIDMAVHIYGESMYPDIPNGSVCYVKRIDPSLFVEWGKAYILDTMNGPLLKYLSPGSDEEHIKCISANHDPMYAPFEVAMQDVIGIYKVVLCMSMK